MTLLSFLSYLSALLGLSSSIFFFIGTVILTPNKIAELSETYFNYNDAIAKSFVVQRLDYTCGAFLLFLSFAIQMVALFQADQSQPLFFQTPIRAISFLLIYVAISNALTLVCRKLFGAYLHKQVNQELK